MRRAACIILAFCFTVNCLAMTGTTASDRATLAPSIYTNRAPIRIDNNTCFNASNGVSGGDGSESAPWIIENYEINGTGNGSCIYIGNTTDFFVVRNCLLCNASGGPGSIYYFNSSLMLFNVSHGTLLNNSVRWSEYGIYLYYNSHNNTVVRNAINNNYGTGLLMDSGSEGNEALNNIIFGNGLHGVYVYNGLSNLIMNNSVYDNSNSGIYLYSSRDNIVRNNTVRNNTVFGVHIYLLSDFNMLRYNNISDNGYGVRVHNSEWNTICTNDFFGNTGHAYDNSGQNMWNMDYPDGGNYWDDYIGNDVMNGPDQDIPGNDGFGDAPYTNIDGGSGANDSYPLMLPFNTVAPADTVPPAAVSWGPTGNGTQPGLIFIQWNESMNWTSVEEAFRYTDGTFNYSSANGTWVHDLAFNSTFTPAVPLMYEGTYTVIVNCTARDFSGNYLDCDGDGTGGEWPEDVLVWNFTVADMAPYIVSTVPADGQIDVDPNKPIKITFSERMNSSSVEEAFWCTNGTGLLDHSRGLVYWNTANTEFTFSPDQPLGLNMTHTAGLDGSLARDYGGRLLEGGNFTWNFRTWLTPPAPHVVDTYPPSGASGVNVNTYINIAFDAEMSPGSLDGAFSYTDGTDVWGIGDGTYDWFSDNTLFSFQPEEKLRFDSTYTVRITSNATSVYGKPLDGNDNGIPDASDDFVFIFTTTPEPPTVVSHYPILNQRDVPVSISAVHINFSKVMLLTSVTNAVSIYPATSFTPSFSGAGMNLTLVLAEELLEGTEYRVTVLGTATDMDGIKLDGNSDGWSGDKFVFTFFTEGFVEPVMPRILRVWPTKNSTIPADSASFYVSVTFNVAMNKTSVEQAFTFANGTQKVNGTYAWSDSGASFRFVPTDAFGYNVTYTCTLLGSAADEYGNTLGNATVWHYTTENAVSTSDWMDWIAYGAIAFLIAMVTILYMANRSLRRDLKRARVKMKRLKRQHGILDDEPAELVLNQPDGSETSPEGEPEGQDLPAERDG